MSLVIAISFSYQQRAEILFMNLIRYYKAWISEWGGRTCTQNLKISSKRIMRIRRFLAWKFLLLWNKIPHFQKIHWFLCNGGQFLSARGNFLLPIGVDSFLILPGMEYSSIQKFGTYSWNILYFTSFRRNNKVCIYAK